MSSTSLVQRVPSASTISNTVTNTLTPSSRQQSSQTRDSTLSSTLSAASSTATSMLPKLNLTPQKSSTSTPQKSSTSQQASSPAISTPGQWQHPRMQEVIKRQNATRFDASNMRVIGLNAGFLVGSWLVPLIAANMLPRAWLLPTEPYATYTLYLLRLFFALNIALAFAPAFRLKDSCEDVPLTPSQRQLLGLPPMSRPATPQEQQQYTTPPRYSRSATPQSGSSPGLRAALTSGSPLSGRGTPLDTSQLRRSVSGSSPRPSPLGTGQRRSSLNRSSPFDTSDFDAAGNVSTPTKSNKASVGLNSKWLYEKGRGSPRSSFSGFGGFGGAGSVFN